MAVPLCSVYQVPTRPPPPPPVIPALAGWGGRQARCIRRGGSQGGDGPRARCLHQNRLSCHPDFSVTSTPADPCSWGFNVNLNVEKNLLPSVVFFQKKEVGNAVRKGVRWTKPNSWKCPQLPSTEGNLLLALFHIFPSMEVFFPLIVSSCGTAEIKRVSG